MRSCTSLTLLALAVATPALAYPPGVGVLTNKRNCVACHPPNGPWSDEAKTIVDVLDAETKKSLKTPGGEFTIEVRRNQTRTVLTVIGRVKGEPKAPRRNGWLYVDPMQIDLPTLSKFAPVGRQPLCLVSCRRRQARRVPRCSADRASDDRSPPRCGQRRRPRAALHALERRERQRQA